MSVLGKIAFWLLIVGGSHALLDPEGVKCGEKHCSTLEYCSRFDSHCRPCSEICELENHNYQPEECTTDCQEYLHDQRYVLRSEISEYEDLRGEVRRLRTLLTVAITITCLMVLAIFFLLGKAFLRWEKVKNVCCRAFPKKTWAKVSANKRRNDGGVVVSSQNNNNKVQEDPEIGVGAGVGVGGGKETGLKLTMPTISASVAPSRCTGTGNGTPNTTSTPLSRRHPSEDTTLDYAYDNPAMTPSPETLAAHNQLRTKRESSF